MCRLHICYPLLFSLQITSATMEVGIRVWVLVFLFGRTYSRLGFCLFLCAGSVMKKRGHLFQILKNLSTKLKN
ncbi:hypothetical protein L2E82_34526 [Cichorium intybus]|uniref:Uncharacterized protein n=1 Tax=Cichorium intybus TaxID=13427 RepID=A0ACB9BM90_CICIN|nr:hypothetical protein L2E82_34526 [Cichorium intybus]